jgi:hypothetical protein
MGYVFDQETLPKMVAAKPGRQRIFFVREELAEGDRPYSVGGKRRRGTPKARIRPGATSSSQQLALPTRPPTVANSLPGLSQAPRRPRNIGRFPLGGLAPRKPLRARNSVFSPLREIRPITGQGSEIPRW